MKNERVYTGTELRDALNVSYYKSHGYSHGFTYDDIMTLILAWSCHPKFGLISESAAYKRENPNGEVWLKKSEIPSFQSYIGYHLLRYLD